MQSLIGRIRRGLLYSFAPLPQLNHIAIVGIHMISKVVMFNAKNGIRKIVGKSPK